MEQQGEPMKGLRNKLLAVAGLLALLPLSGIGAAVAQELNVSGDFHIHSTGARFHTGTLHLLQSGETIVGTFHDASGSGVTQMSGKIHGRTIDGTWRGPTGETGWLTIKFANVQSFEGAWGYNGRTPGGHFVGLLVRAGHRS
jgi:hypothetical protein